MLYAYYMCILLCVLLCVYCNSASTIHINSVTHVRTYSYDYAQSAHTYICTFRGRQSEDPDGEADQLVRVIRDKAESASAQKRKAKQNMER